MEYVMIRNGFFRCAKNIIEGLCDGVRAWIICTLSLPCIGCESIFPFLGQGSSNCLGKARRIKVGVNKREAGVGFIEVGRGPYPSRGEVHKGSGGEVIFGWHGDIEGHEGIVETEWNDVSCPILVVWFDDPELTREGQP